MKIEYPKALYSASGECRLVRNPEEHEAVGDGWKESPVKHNASPKPSAPLPVDSGSVEVPAVPEPIDTPKLTTNPLPEFVQGAVEEAKQKRGKK